MKLFVAGCSISDYTKVSKVYGEFLAEKLGCEYVHEGAGCGSNWRIWRVITNHIMTGNLTPDDLLVVQYTGREREEFWSRFDPTAAEMSPNSLDHLCVTEVPNFGGSIIRYKAGAGEWQDQPVKDFFNTYEQNHLHTKFERERFRAHNFMFQHMLLTKNIRTIFVRSRRSPPMSLTDLLPEFRNEAFVEPYDDISAYDLSSEDYAHMSQLGHEVFAGWLYDHINKFNLKG
jgi:hypothetical protein